MKKPKTQNSTRPSHTLHHISLNLMHHVGKQHWIHPIVRFLRSKSWQRLAVSLSLFQTWWILVFNSLLDMFDTLRATFVSFRTIFGSIYGQITRKFVQRLSFVQRSWFGDGYGGFRREFLFYRALRVCVNVYRLFFADKLGFRFAFFKWIRFLSRISQF